MKLNPSIVVFMNKNTDIVDRWTVIYPDGAVFTMADKESGYLGLVTYHSQYSDWDPDSEDVEVKHSHLPKDLVEQIKKYET